MSISIEKLHEYVKAMSQKAVQNADQQVVKRAVIEESYPGGYNIKLVNGETTVLTKAVSINPQKAFNKDDYVYVIKATMKSGDTFTDEYYIFGLVSETNEKFANLSEWERFIVLNDVLPFQVKSIDNLIQIPITNIEKKLVITNADEILFKDGLNEQRTFSLSAIFNCPDNWEVQSGDYGLKIEIKMEGDKTETFYLSTQYFSGQPYDLKNSMQRKLIVLKDLSSEITEVNISLFSNIDYNGADFYVKNIQLQLGKLLDISDKLNVRIAPRNNSRDYFFYGKANDEITIEAAAYYEDQLLFGDSLKYYWEVEQEVKNEDGITTKEWVCINKFSKEPALSSNELVTIYAARDNFIKLFSNDTYFSTFETKLRCRVQYQLAEKISPEIIIKNFNKHEYKATLIAKPADGRIIKKTDRVRLTCEVKEFNKKFNINDINLIYSWKAGDDFIESYNNKTLAIAAGDSEHTGFKDYTLTTDIEINKNKIYYILTDTSVYEKVKNPNKNDLNTYYDEPTYYLPVDVDTMLFTSAVAADIEEDETADNFNIPFDGNNFIEIQSYVQKPIIEETNYKYYVSTSILGYKEIEEKDWQLFKYDIKYEKTKDTEIDKNKVYYKQDNNAKDGYIEVNNPKKEDIGTYYEKIFSAGEIFPWSGIVKDKAELFTDDIITGENGIYFVYYTESIVWKQENNIIRAESWSKPSILRKVEKNADVCSDFSREEVAELNVFNILSKNGTSQGVFPAENGDLYINATYLKTGTITVGKENSPMFYASIHNPEVTIGGFKVDENSIETKNFGSEEDYGFKISSDSNDENFIDTKDFKVSGQGAKITAGTIQSNKFSKELKIESFIDDGYSRILGRGNCKDKNIIIPTYNTDGTYFKEIYTDAFKNDKNLESIIFSDKFESIGEGVFSYCENLKEVYLPKTINYIAENAFLQTFSNIHFYYQGSEEEWKNLKDYEMIVDSTVLKSTNVTYDYNYNTGMEINLSNSTITTQNFKLDSKGKVTAKNANIQGKIEANSGTIGGFTISSSGISKYDEVGNKDLIKIDSKEGKIILNSSTSSDSINLKGGQGLSIGQGDYQTRYNFTGTELNVVYDSASKKIGRAFIGAAPDYVQGYHPSLVMSADSQYCEKIVLGYCDNLFFNNVPEVPDTTKYAGIKIFPGAIEYNGNVTETVSTTTSSDENKKHDIKPISDEYSEVFKKLKPVTFKYNNGTSNRYHTGFIAQDLKQAIEDSNLTTQDMAAYVEYKDGDINTCGIRYSELIALCVNEIQKLQSKVEELENKINDKEAKL